MADGSAAGWYADPQGRHEQRYWDGNGWTDHVSDAGTAGTDPVAAPPQATTTTYPAASATAAPPAAAPVGFTTPARSGGPNGKVLALAAAAVVVVLVVVVLVMKNNGDSGQRAQLVDDCVDEGGESDRDDRTVRRVCECIVDELLDEGLSIDELEEFDRDSRENGVVDPEIRDDITSAARSCAPG